MKLGGLTVVNDTFRAAAPSAAGTAHRPSPSGDAMSRRDSTTRLDGRDHGTDNHDTATDTDDPTIAWKTRATSSGSIS